MQSWEYLAVSEWQDESALNALGAKGWELVAVACDEVGIYYFFKRPRQSATRD